MSTGHMAASWSLHSAGALPPDTWIDTAFVHITQLASIIESDPVRVEEWYRSVRIRELGGRTAKELVLSGDADLVIRFLYSIGCGERD
jgi:hypothetical protein